VPDAIDTPLSGRRTYSIDMCEMRTPDDYKRAFDKEWQATDMRAVIQTLLRDCYFDKSGHEPLHQVNNRQHDRYFICALRQS
jgi:hypothetical protein